jgi:hypothetical protein
MRRPKLHRSEVLIRSRGDAISNAARVLIGIVRSTERIERGRSSVAELSLEVELTGGGVETWKITIERTASSH